MKPQKTKAKADLEREIQYFKRLAFSAFLEEPSAKERGFLSESHPEDFQILANRWEELLRIAKQNWFVQSGLRISECLKELGETIGTLGGGPSDVAELYLETLKKIEKAESFEMPSSLLDVGRSMAIELMGRLADYYGKNSYLAAGDLSRPLALPQTIHKTPQQRQIRILLVEDNPGDAEFLRDSLKKVGHGHIEIVWVTSLKDAVRVLAQESFSAVITDLSLGDSDKETTFEKVLNTSGGIPVIVMTGLDDEELALTMVRGGAQDYIVKGQIDARSLFRSIRFSVERKGILDELQLAREEANKATHAKSQFLANMSHEIRTPLNSILGMAQVFLEAPLDSEHKKYAELLNRAGKSLLHLIDEILDLSKVEAGKLDLEEAPFDLTDVVEDSIELSSVKAREKGLELSYRISDKIPSALFGDANRLRQILMNLLGNAIKFTEKGRVQMEVAPDPSGGEPGSIQVSVKDTGIGISQEKLSKIFDSFSQAHGRPELFGGTGLGLTISKRLAEKLGGRIGCISEEGKGSTFFFTARFLIAPQAPPQEAESLKILQNARVLIVEPDARDQEELSKILGAWRMSVAIASSVDEGLGELMRSAATKPLDLVLVNCRLPREGGFRFVEFIREIPSFRGKVVMILPADHLKEDPARCKRMGLPHFLIKPVRRAELRQTLAKAITKEATLPKPDSEASKESHGKHVERQRILLVEDMPDNQFVVRVFLKDHPCEIDIAENGMAAVEKAKVGPYDLIFMDMRMPVMDGYEATRQIRRWEKQQTKKPIPIVALTASTLKGEEYKALQAGCDAHLQKPIVKSRLLEALSRFAPAKPHADGSSDKKQEATEEIDPEIRELIPVFLGRRREDVQKMRKAIEARDFETIRTLGHNMKGSGGYYGFDALSQLGKKIETAGRERSPESAAQLLEELIAFLNHAEASIK